MLKKSKLLILALAFTMLLTACGGGSKPANKNAEKGNGDTAVSEFEPGKVDGVLDINIASEP